MSIKSGKVHRPSEDGRAPLSRESAPRTSSRLGFPTQRLALTERKPRHSSSSFSSWEGHTSSPNNEREKRQNRRANGTSAGEKAGCNERSRSEQTDSSPATGDFLSPVVLPGRCGDTFQAQHHSLCASAALRCLLWAGGWICVYLRYLRFKRAGGRICVICGQS